MWAPCGFRNSQASWRDLYKSRWALGNLGEMEDILPRFKISQTSWRDLYKSRRDLGNLGKMEEISPWFRISQTSWRDLISLGEISVKILHGFTLLNYVISFNYQIFRQQGEGRQFLWSLFVFITLSSILNILKGIYLIIHQVQDCDAVKICDPQWQKYFLGNNLINFQK